MVWIYSFLPLSLPPDPTTGVTVVWVEAHSPLQLNRGLHSAVPPHRLTQTLSNGRFKVIKSFIIWANPSRNYTSPAYFKSIYSMSHNGRSCKTFSASNWIPLALLHVVHSLHSIFSGVVWEFRQGNVVSNQTPPLCTYGKWWSQHVTATIVPSLYLKRTPCLPNLLVWTHVCTQNSIKASMIFQYFVTLNIHLSFPSSLSHFPLSNCAPGDKRHRAGFQAASSDGLPSSAAPADAGLLAERQERSAKVPWYCQHVGQNDTQPCISQSRHQQRGPWVSRDTNSFTYTNTLFLSHLSVSVIQYFF